MAIASLILGIIGLLSSCFLIGAIPAIISIVLGVISIKKGQGKGMAIAGIVLSAISLVIILFMFAFAGMGAAISSTNTTESNISETTEAQTTEAETTIQEVETEAEAESETETEEETSDNNIFYVGDILETKNIKLSYLSCGEYHDDNMFVEPGEGNKFVYFEFEFENIGNSDTSVGSLDFDCYADGYEAQSPLATADNVMASIASLSPGRKLGGIVVFEIPSTSETVEVEYETSFWTQNKAIFMFE